MWLRLRVGAWLSLIGFLTLTTFLAFAQVWTERTIAVTLRLSLLPRLAPAHTFSDRVMVRVPVFVPWWVSLRDTVKPWIPVSQPARIGLGVLATAAASVISVVFLWVMTQTDVLALASGAAGNRVQELFAQGVQSLVAAVFGEGALGLIQQAGPVGLTVAFAGIAAAGALAILGRRSENLPLCVKDILEGCHGKDRSGFFLVLP